MTVNSDATKTDWVDPDDAPELDDVWFDKADHYRGETLVQRGRPKGADKISTTIRFDADVLAAFKQDGPGWQTRMNQALRDWLKRKSDAA
ncbi:MULTISPECIES: BrnA antitoxin family protein [Brevundimonas]|jgi:uncharacterized protein (DUF4415 family)|uniref:BrnA antitoxin family protein n=1 Tax=Brevundimonas TaxID=41275 RepID=UPI00128F96D1|nr:MULTISPECIES: BrnA antitoxin family protein [Brevundimonas]QFU32876.1 hypothetical protein BSP_14530 [Brevundimonas sp. Bb-A]